MSEVTYSVFTKPWRTLAVSRLAKHVRALGFEGVELPVRPGFQVEPEQVERDLPRAARVFRSEGTPILSVAGPADERTIAACARADVPVLRVMAPIGPDERYDQAEERLHGEYERLLPMLVAHGVRLGIQNHCGRYVPNALGLRAILWQLDPRFVGAVWDAAHEALVGMPPELALDVIWPHLCMVNLKSGYWRRISGPEAEVASWGHYWTDGRHGLADWPRVICELKRRAYTGVICLTAEYSDGDAVDRLISRDLSFVRALYAGSGR